MERNRYSDSMVDLVWRQVRAMDQDQLTVIAKEARNEMQRRRRALKLAKAMFLEQCPQEQGNKIRCTWEGVSPLGGSVSVTGLHQLRKYRITVPGDQLINDDDRSIRGCIDTGAIVHATNGSRLSLVQRGAA